MTPAQSTNLGLVQNTDICSVVSKVNTQKQKNELNPNINLKSMCKVPRKRKGQSSNQA